MDLGNPFGVVFHHLLIREMASLGCRDEFPMKSALVCIVYTLDKTYDES